MRSKTLKQAPLKTQAKPAAHVCSESELSAFAVRLLQSVELGTVVFLEGELGAGKSTLVRECVRALCSEKVSFSGSPTYPLCHQYVARDGSKISHLDFYRLRSAAEIRERGLEESIWDLKSRVFIEWGSLFPEVVEELKKAGRKVLQLKMELIDENPEFRKITQLS